MHSIINSIEEKTNEIDYNIENSEEESIAEDEKNSENMNAPNNDFCFTQDDFLPVAGSSPALTHKDKYKETQSHIESLNGTKLKVGSGNEEIEWKVVPGVFEDDMADTIKAEKEAFEKSRLKFVDDFPNKFDLLLKMWPGDFWDDLNNLNKYIEERNIERKKQLQRVYREVSKHEFITFHMLFILASQCAKLGTRLWNPSPNSSFVNKVDFSPYMKEWRFKEIRSLIPFVMKDDSVKTTDDWWMFSKRVKQFNYRRTKIKRSSINVLDESMSAFVPR